MDGTSPARSLGELECSNCGREAGVVSGLFEGRHEYLPAGPCASVPLWTGAERDWSRIKDSIRISGCSVSNVICWVPVPRELFVDYSWDGLGPSHDVLPESAL